MEPKKRRHQLGSGQRRTRRRFDNWTPLFCLENEPGDRDIPEGSNRSHQDAAKSLSGEEVDEIQPLFDGEEELGMKDVDSEDAVLCSEFAAEDELQPVHQVWGAVHPVICVLSEEEEELEGMHEISEMYDQEVEDQD